MKINKKCIYCGDFIDLSNVCGYIITDEFGYFYLGTYGDMGEKLTWVEDIKRAIHFNTYEEAKKVADKKQQGAKVNINSK